MSEHLNYYGATNNDLLHEGKPLPLFPSGLEKASVEVE